MQNLIGPPLLFLAAAIVWFAYARRRKILLAERAIAAAGLPDPRPPLHPSLVVIGDVVPPLMIGGLVFLGLKLTLAYAVAGEALGVGLLDLAGALSLLAAYGVWLKWKTQHRPMPEGWSMPAVTAAPAQLGKPLPAGTAKLGPSAAA
ncbi:MAG: hypothetical protein NZ523_08075 [Elioraea sp.]|nr:hypothetical protein [Elioraea sp.]MDW8445225.1 hypothetical protein [Acetobacteraceae bacterium]